MSKSRCIVTSLVLCLSLSTSWISYGLAGEKVTAEQVVTLHQKSLGSPEALAALKTLAFVGTTSVEFILGATGKMSGKSMCVSDGKKLAISLKYGDVNYPGEYFAYDGKDVSVGHISPGQKSPIADFLFRYNGIMKEGLLGGVFSAGWPLLNLKERQVDLKYRATTVDGRQMHEIEYRPKNSLRDMKIKLYFDAETNRHVKTEYRVRVRDDMSGVPGGDGTRTGRFQGGQQPKGLESLSQGLPDSIYVLTERFDDFKTEGTLTLPHSYTIDYSVEGQGSTFIAKWTVQATQWAFNQTYDGQLFVAQK